MAGSITDIKLASNGLMLLGHNSISAFDEPSAGAQIANALFESSYNGLLTAYRWRFATKKAKLARLSAAPLNDFLYQFQLPSDLLYLIKATDINYEIYEDKLYSNNLEEEIDYIFKVSSDKLPPYFIKTLEFFLASQFALPITGDLNKMQAMINMYQGALRQAKFTDATQRPQESFVDNPYVDVRD